MFKIREDNTYNDIREKSLMSWLVEVQDTGSYNDACGAKLAVEYIQHLKKKIEILEEKNRMKDQHLKKIKQKLDNLK
ncbi:MAG: hypothetical protein PUG60_06730 [Lachnospiraceae bacterium]|nr:hypothetical protein [Lachnospiraceae bacterium]MDY4969492.1 hypothetical protein [Lachnospiraceae bacterium]